MSDLRFFRGKWEATSLLWLKEAETARLQPLQGTTSSLLPHLERGTWLCFEASVPYFFSYSQETSQQQKVVRKKIANLYRSLPLDLNFFRASEYGSGSRWEACVVENSSDLNTSCLCAGSFIILWPGDWKFFASQFSVVGKIIQKELQQVYHIVWDFSYTTRSHPKM